MQPTRASSRRAFVSCAVAAAASSVTTGGGLPWAPSWGAASAAEPPKLGLSSSGSLRACPKTDSPTASGCVSSAPGSSPNRFMAPLRFDTNDRELAFKRAKAYLASEYELLEADSPAYLHAVTTDAEDLELHFLDADPVVTFRLVARNPTPMPAFCASRGCINGNQQQRTKIQTLRDGLGWRSDDSKFDGEKFEGWVPIFLH